MKKATTVDEQIQRLKSRGMIINDDKKAKEILLDIGYYRLGFYWFPFEKNYPNKKNRTHDFKANTSFENVVNLYYFDHDLRCILSPYLSRIEINLRTFLIYTASNRYKENPTWFADGKYVHSNFLQCLPFCYDNIKKNDAISMHHKKYINDQYAPAWKTLEYMTFGDILCLIFNLNDKNLQKEIANHFNIKNFDVFQSHLNTIRLMRNLCAHGHNIYDLNLQKSIKAGPLSKMKGSLHHNLSGTLMVISYILKSISKNRNNELIGKLNVLVSDPKLIPLKDIIDNIQIPKITK